MMPRPSRLFSALALWSAAASVQAQDVITNDDDVYCLTLHEDLMRRQHDEWGSAAAFGVDDGTKHTPFTTFNPETRQATVIVGNGDDVGGVYHPMIASDNPTTVHFIMTLYAVDQNHQLFATETMDPNMPAPATVVFDVPPHVTEMTAYEFCNLHGLWMGPTVPTLSGNTTTMEEKSGEELEHCHIDSPLAIAYDSFAADFVRRQSLPPFNSLEPYDEDDGTKHTPYIKLHNNGTATVTVGIPGNFHVMKGASRELDENGDSVEPHWITEIYVMDQLGDIITMESLNPTNVDIAQTSFEIPPEATTLTAYEWCNVHGLYRGPTISVETGEVVVTTTPEDELESYSAATTRVMSGMMVVVAAALMI